MQIRNFGLARWLPLAALAFGVEAANAPSGYTITERQEEAIKVGMHAEDVQRILGHPMQNIQYRNARGPMWYYDVIGMVVPTVFEVAFDANGVVISAREFPDLSRNSGP